MTSTAPRRESIGAILALAGNASIWSRRSVKLGLAGLLVAAVIALVSMLRSGSDSVRYVTEPVTRGGLVVTVTATGSVQPTNKVDVSSELSGTVRKVLVDYNSEVVPGQTLATLDTDKLAATLDNARAKLVAARARVADADAAVVQTDKELIRKRALAARNWSSAHDLEVAQAAYDKAVASAASARADVGAAEADLRLNETNLAKSNIVSPIKGVVLKRNVDPGQTVASNFQAPVLFSIAEDLRQMELQVDVDEADVGKVKAGLVATFGVDAFPDRKFPAKIRYVRVASETIQGVVTYKAVLDIDNAELLLRPGMTATAEIRVAEVPDALLVTNQGLRYAPPRTQSSSRSLLQRLIGGPPQFRPPSARDQSGPNRQVWVLRDGKPAQVAITIGQSDGRRTAVDGGGLSAGDALIVDQTAVR
jgi:HlyD family secretion protein